MKKRLWILCLALPLLAACSAPVKILNVIVPHSGYEVHRDIAYGENSRQKLDIYVPDKAKAAGVIVYFYGGSWQYGDRDMYRFVGQAFASRGYITVVPDYRLYPEVHFPTFVEDGAQAVAWVHEHIGEYGGDPEKLFLAGHSAGGYIAVMLTLNESYLSHAGASRGWIKGTAGLAGPYDFLPFTDPNIKEIFSTAEDAATQPITYAAAGAPPLLLMTGDQDDEVLPGNATRLAARLKSADVPVTVKIYKGVAHLGIALALADGFRDRAPVLDDIDHFIHLRTAKPVGGFH